MLGGAGLFMAIESQAEIQRQTLILHELNAFLGELAVKVNQ